MSRFDLWGHMPWHGEKIREFSLRGSRALDARQLVPTPHESHLTHTLREPFGSHAMR